MATPPRAKKDSWSGKGWTVYTKKGPIFSSREIDNAERSIGIPMPEMIFGNNEVGLEHTCGWGIRFNALGALDLVDKHGHNLLKVAHAAEWMSTRKDAHTSAEGHKIEGIVKPFDWTYSTPYRGSTQQDSPKQFNHDSEAGIPVELLARPDPILFFGDVSLYEDELGDNGLVSLNVKVRVMEERLLLLCRFYLRVDGVVFRVRDTRVYVEFGEKKVVREHLESEDDYETVKKKLPAGSKDFSQFFADPNWVSKNLTITKVTRETLYVD